MDTSSQVLLALVFGCVCLFLFRAFSGSQQPAQHVIVKKAPRELKTYTRAEVAQHSSPQDAWIIVKDPRSGVKRVFDVTSFVDEHPGGESILNNVGRDSTEGFYGPQHPATVFVMVEEFCIGSVEEE